MVVVAIINPTEMATITTTCKANRAPCGRPAPNSFETLVLIETISLSSYISDHVSTVHRVTL
uniref:TRANSPARENT TESTA 12 protein n=1 Tax=Solanum tuberosum TaxID=4113 RepID=M1A5S9_SOLTU